MLSELFELLWAGDLALSPIVGRRLTCKPLIGKELELPRTSGQLRRQNRGDERLVSFIVWLVFWLLRWAS